MIVPWIVNSSLKVVRLTKLLLGTANCTRMRMAMAPAIKNMMKLVTM